MWRLLDHGPGPPAWNMAVDEVLRRSHAENGGHPTLRLYQWACPTLSLGAGQHLPAALTPDRLAALGLTVVRRPTGGRAVVHGGDLTYAMVAGCRDGFPASIPVVYRRLQAGLQRGLAKLGIDTAAGVTSAAVGFSCFAHLGRGDLAWQGRKLAGSAQSWQGQSFLQHGAILLTPQQETWQQLLGLLDQEMTLPITSLQEILGELPPLADVQEVLRQGWEEELGIRFKSGELTAWERHLLAKDYGFAPEGLATAGWQPGGGS